MMVMAATPSLQRTSIRDLKRMRGGGELESLTRTIETEVAKLPPTQPRANSNAGATIDDATRAKHWSMLGPILRIQRWYRRVRSIRQVRGLAAARAQHHHDVWLNTSAGIIQAAWFAYKRRRRMEEGGLLD